MITIKERNGLTINNPDEGEKTLFLDTDGKLKTKNENGLIEEVSASGGVPNLTVNQIAFGDSNNLITSDAGLTYDISQGIFIVKNTTTTLFDIRDNLWYKIGDIDGANDGNVFTILPQDNVAYYDNKEHGGFFGINTSTPTVALDVVGTVNISQALALAPMAFADLPASPAAGMLSHISDSDTVTWGATISGGGANTVLAFYNGTVWTVMGK